MIIRKKKICKGSCKQPCYPFSKGMCFQCWNKANNKPLKPSKTKIKPISDKHKIELEEYREKRDSYMAEHTCCERCGSKEALELHHKKGRGKWLLQYFCVLCKTCHSWAHGFPKQAIEEGYLLSRLN